LYYEHMFIKFAKKKRYMSRPKKERLIQMAPHFDGFEPAGSQYSRHSAVMIDFEEYEALNLCDYELLRHEEAAKLMNISRPTFTRIYERVRRKIAEAFIEGKPIRFNAGKSLTTHWFKCDNCNITFSHADNNRLICPVCKSNEIKINI
jgi:uncharacterized protein